VKGQDREGKSQEEVQIGRRWLGAFSQRNKKRDPIWDRPGKRIRDCPKTEKTRKKKKASKEVEEGRGKAKEKPKRIKIKKKKKGNGN